MNLARMPTDEIFKTARAQLTLAEAVYRCDQDSTLEKETGLTILSLLSAISDCLAHLQARLHGGD